MQSYIQHNILCCQMIKYRVLSTKDRVGQDQFNKIRPPGPTNSGPLAQHLQSLRHHCPQPIITSFFIFFYFTRFINVQVCQPTCQIQGCQVTELSSLHWCHRIVYNSHDDTSWSHISCLFEVILAMLCLLVGNAAKRLPVAAKSIFLTELNWVPLQDWCNSNLISAGLDSVVNNVVASCICIVLAPGKEAQGTQSCRKIL